MRTLGSTAAPTADIQSEPEQSFSFSWPKRAGIPVWQRSALWALGDQALFSGSNFIISIMLARWLTPAAYGAYSLGYSAFLMFAALHSAILVEPMLVFGPGKYASRFWPYVKSLLRGHGFLVIPASGCLLITSFGFGRVYPAAVRNAILGVAIGAGGTLLFWLVRRVFYVVLWPSGAALASGAYLLSVITAMVILRETGLLSEFSAFLAMAVASVCASSIALALFRHARKVREEKVAQSEVVTDHWVYGRWAVCTAVIQWFPANIYFSALPRWVGLEASGALRVLMNVAMPVLQAIAALSMLLLPSLVRRRRAGPSQLAHMMLRYLLLFVLGSGIYAAVFWIFRYRLFQFVSGGNYSAYIGTPLMLACLLPFGTACSAVLGNGLRAMEHPDQLFWCHVASLIAAFGVGLPLASRYGVTGALIAIHISSLVSISIMAWLCRATLQKECLSYTLAVSERS